MRAEAIVLIAEDDDSDFALIRRSLEQAGLHNPVVRFRDGQELLSFFSMGGNGSTREPNGAFVLFLDDQIPRVGGLEVLEKLKDDAELRKVPTIVLAGEDDAALVERCQTLNCSICMVKPKDRSAFADAIRKMGSFLSVVEIPTVL